MASRTVLPLAALSLCVALVSLSPTPATADTRVGRLGILCDVHGYRVGDYVVVPLRGIAEWLGAEVTYKNPTIELKRGKHLTKTTLNKKTATVDGRQITLPTAPKVYDGITCVPLRLISAAFPVDVEYKADGDDSEVERMAGRPFVKIASREKTARVLVHRCSPAVTAAIVRVQEQAFRKSGFGPNGDMWQYGTDWVFTCGSVLKHGYVWSTDPYSWEEPGAYWPQAGFMGQGGEGAIWKRAANGWGRAGYVSLDQPWEQSWREAGAPEDTIAQLKAGVR